MSINKGFLNKKGVGLVQEDTQKGFDFLQFASDNRGGFEKMSHFDWLAFLLL